MKRSVWLVLSVSLLAVIASGCRGGSNVIDSWTRPADEMEMVYVPAGEFEMGIGEEEAEFVLELCQGSVSECDEWWFEDELPAHTVTLDAFWIDRTEVTAEQFRRCVEAGACEPPADAGSGGPSTTTVETAGAGEPVVFVSWHQAQAYCTWAGARLPTEAEWEYVARGPESRRYPWGDEFDGSRLSYCDAGCALEWADGAVSDGYAGPAPAGSFPTGASWCGALDMAGNVWEWVADWYDEEYYGESPAENPPGPSSGRSRVLRGGSWVDAPYNLRSSSRMGPPPEITLEIAGFRCARDDSP